MCKIKIPGLDEDRGFSQIMGAVTILFPDL